jgi:hypothetical protein
MANDLGAHIATEVTRAETDYQNVRSRALSIVGVTSGLVTLITALLGVAEAEKLTAILGAARWSLFGGLVIFVLSTLCALLINRPQDITASNTDSLTTLVANDWDDEGWDRSVAEFLVKYLATLRNDNKRTASLLRWAIAFQLGGVGAFTITSLLIILKVK